MIAMEEIKYEYDEKEKEQAILDLKEKIKTKSMICKKCKKIIGHAGSNRQKYCDKCRKEIRKQQAKKYMKKRRKKSKRVGSDVSR